MIPHIFNKYSFVFMKFQFLDLVNYRSNLKVKINLIEINMF